MKKAQNRKVLHFRCSISSASISILLYCTSISLVPFSLFLIFLHL
uniref:Uncharacterized protein n=1 Tax=Solanum lycopersicum TaxID=4081 RepID=A0A3Q7GXC8_SOLLC